MRRSWCCRSGTTSLAHQIRSPSVSLTSPPPSARDDKLGGIRRANTVAEFTQVIRKFSEIGEQEFMRIFLENKNLFNENEHYFTNIEDLRAEFRYGDFGQSITFHNQEQVSFNTLQGIVLDCLPDDLLRQENYKQKWDSAYCKLKDLVKQLNIQVPVKLRSCDEICKCSDFYRNNQLKIDRFFNI